METKPSEMCVLQVVPDGFGVAYMTGYDGWTKFFFSYCNDLIQPLDRLQFTITSRREMPNTQFVQEIARAAQDIQALHQDTTNVKSKM